MTRPVEFAPFELTVVSQIRNLPSSIPILGAAAGGTMRAIVGLYLVIGIVMLAIGFLLPGPCPNRNTDIVSNLVFVLTWPVGLYSEVYHGRFSVEDWLHAQACAGGGDLGTKKI